MSLSATAQSSLGATTLPAIDESDAPKSVVMRSVYDTFFAAIARRSEHAAKIARENRSVLDALRTAGAWVAEFCAAKACAIDDVVVTGSLSREGHIMLKISMRGDLE